MDRAGTFDTKYAELEKEFKRQAEMDGAAYLPAIRPKSPVDFVFVGMEPSLNFAGPPKHPDRKAMAESKIASGLRNSMFTIYDFILHYSIRNFLCDADAYYITDLSKGAMLVRDAQVNPRYRYERWYPMLLEEISLVLKQYATVFAIGGRVEHFLKTRPSPFPYTLMKIMHFSAQAVAFYAGKRIAQRGAEDRFNEFKDTVRMEHILRAAEDVMSQAGLCSVLKDQTLSRLNRKKWLTHSQQELIFLYKMDFEEFRATHSSRTLSEKPFEMSVIPLTKQPSLVRGGLAMWEKFCEPLS